MFIVNCHGEIFSFNNVSDALKKAIWLSSTREHGCFCDILEQQEGKEECIEIGYTCPDEDRTRMKVSLSYPMEKAEALPSKPDLSTAKGLYPPSI